MEENHVDIIRRETGKKMWQVTVHADDAELPEIDLPVFAKKSKGALKQARKIVKALQREDGKACSTCMTENRIQGSVRCRECTDMFGYDE